MRLHVLLTCAVLLSASCACHADSFTFSASGVTNPFSGSGTLTASDNGDGSYTITGVSGPGVTGLINFANNDNLLFPTQDPILDPNGFSFFDQMGNTGYDVNIYANGVDQYSALLVDTDGFSQVVPIDFSVSAVTPEPSSILLLGTGLLGVAGVLRRRVL